DGIRRKRRCLLVEGLEDASGAAAIGRLRESPSRLGANSGGERRITAGPFEEVLAVLRIEVLVLGRSAPAPTGAASLHLAEPRVVEIDEAPLGGREQECRPGSIAPQRLTSRC